MPLQVKVTQSVALKMARSNRRYLFHCRATENSYRLAPAQVSVLTLQAMDLCIFYERKKRKSCIEHYASKMHLRHIRPDTLCCVSFLFLSET